MSGALPLDMRTGKLRSPFAEQHAGKHAKARAPQEAFEIAPRSVVFEEVERGLEYACALSVRNLGHLNRRIRVRPPTTKFFSLRTTDDQPVLAPGLAHEVEIVFLAGDAPLGAGAALRDRVLIESDDVSIEVPIEAHPPRAALAFPRTLDFGAVAAASSAPQARLLEFVNQGSRQGLFRIALEGNAAKCAPSEGLLAPGERAQVRVELAPASQLGPGPVCVQGKVTTATAAGASGGEAQDMQVTAITVLANVAESVLQLACEEGLLKQLHFGVLHFGTEQAVTARLVNNSPQATSFAVSVRQEEKSAVALAEDLRVVPSEGRVEAFGEVSLRFVFAPRLREKRSGFKSQGQGVPRVANYALRAVIEAQESKQLVDVPVTASAEEDTLQVSQFDFGFGDCCVGQSCQIVGTLRNLSKHLSVPFVFSSVAQFAVWPREGVVAPLESLAFRVVFTPKQLGDFSETARLRIGRKDSLPIYLRGCSTLIAGPVPPQAIRGVHAVPEDFVSPAVTLQPGAVMTRPRPLPAPPASDDAEADSPPASPPGSPPASPTATAAALAAATLARKRKEKYEPALRESRFAYRPEEAARRGSNRERYSQVLRQSRETREDAAIRDHDLAAYTRTAAPGRKLQEAFRASHGLKDLLSVDPTNEVDMGMRFASGLESPRLPLPQASERLHLEYAMAGYAGPKGKTASRKWHRGGSASRTLKEKPSTPAETRDCTARLTPEQLSRLVPQPRAVNFGQTCVNAPIVRKVEFANPFEQYVMVELRVEAAELARSRPRSQVVPPGETAVFELELKAPHALAGWKHALSYVVNTHHAGALQCEAEVILPSLGLSSSELSFSFDRGNTTLRATESLTLSNQFSVPLDFWVAVDHECFEVEPAKGQVPPQGSVAVRVTFKARHAMKPFKQDLFVCVLDGTKQRVLCSAAVPEAALRVAEPQVDFGTVCVGNAASRLVSVANKGKTRSVLEVASVPFGLSVKPTSAQLEPGASVSLELTLLPTVAVPYSGTLQLEFRGRPEKAPLLQVEVKGSAIIPQLRIAEAEIDLGQITQGNRATHSLTLVNDSAVPVVLFLDLSQHSDFALEWRREDAAAVRAAPAMVDRGDGTAEERADRTFELSVQPNAVLRLALAFAPSCLGDHSFELPLSLRGIACFAPLRRVVAAECVRSRILLQPAAPSLERKVVLSKERAAKHPYVLKLSLSNVDDRELEWALDLPHEARPLSAAASSARAAAAAAAAAEEQPSARSTPLSEVDAQCWRLETTSGKLGARESTTVRVFFAPLTAGEFSQSLQVLLDGKPYLLTRLRGSALFPSLSFDRPELVLPAVPLGVASSASFTVRNEGYETLELKYQVPQDQARAPIQVEFPKGNVLGVGYPELPVTVSFRSERPLAFAARLEFFDAVGNRFGLPVLGCADNCALTTHEYLQQSGVFAIAAAEGKPIQLQPLRKSALKKSVAADEAASKGERADEASEPSTARSAGDPSSEVIETLSGVAATALRFLTAAQLLQVPVASPADLRALLAQLPAALSANGAQAVVAMVEQMSGRKVKPPATVSLAAAAAAANADAQGHTPRTGSAKSGQQRAATVGDGAKKTLRGMETLLAFLKANGALLYSVRAEHLLSDEAREALAQTQPVTPPPEGFTVAAYRGWAEILTQVVRVFALGRITPKHFKSMPGVPAEAANVDAIMQSSNVYSTAENILLKWLTLHNNRSDPINPRRLIDFAPEACDGVAMANVILSHVPHLEGHFRSLTRQPASLEQRQANFHLALEALRKLGMPYPIEAGELVVAPRADVVLLALHLFNSLPHLVPKAVVEFSGNVGDTVTKSIDLTNTSRRAIVYNVSVEGAPEFTVTERSVRLEPHGQAGSSASFPVKCSLRFARLVEARLLFIADGDAAALAVPLVFALRTAAKPRKASHTVTFQTALYEETRRQVEIANPYESDCVFALSLVQKGPARGDGAAATGGAAGSGAKAKDKRRTPPTGAAASAASGKGTEGKDAGDLVSLLARLDAFWCATETVRVKAKDKAVVDVSFLPLFAGKYSADLLLADAASGELSVALSGEVAPPKPLAEIKWSLEDRVASSKEVPQPLVNPQLERARAVFAERARTRNPSLAGAIAAITRALAVEWAVNPNSYAVSSSNSAFTSPPALVLEDERRARGTLAAPANAAAGRKGADGDADTNRSGNKRASMAPAEGGATSNAAAAAAAAATAAAASAGATQSLRVGFLPPAFGTHRADITLESPLDVRVVRLEVQVTSKNATQLLEFRAPCWGAVTQSIPLVNRTDEAFSVKAALSGHASFSGPAETHVAARSTGSYPLTFTPEWTGAVSAKLTLTNSKSGERLNFDLSGAGEEPAAEDSVVIEAVARKPAERLFKVRNPTKSNVVFSVESDLACVSGAATLAVPPASSREYVLRVAPQVAGLHSGTLTFTTPEGRYLWFAVEIRVASPEPEATITLATRVRHAVSAEVFITNPTDEFLELACWLQGEGLDGAPTLTLQPRQRAAYALLYAPVAPRREVGTLTFTNERVGEFGYRLELSAEPAPPVVVPPVECAIGGQQRVALRVENPSDHPVVLTGRSSNPTVFALEAATLRVGAFDSAVAHALFRPSKLSEAERATVVFAHALEGEWVFELSGSGQPPKAAPPLMMCAAIRSRSSALVAFENPFPTPLDVAVSLHGEDAACPFELFLNESRVRLDGKRALSIPVSFAPSAMATSRARVLVEAQAGPHHAAPLRWEFPITGVAEGPSAPDILKLAAPARGSTRRELTLPLLGLTGAAPAAASDAGEEFFVTIVARDPAHDRFVAGALVVELLTTKLPASDESAAQPSLQATAIFEPLRQMHARADLVVHKRSGGRWKFPLELEATPPPVDDVIHLTSSIGKTAVGRFTLENLLEDESRFTAQITVDSAPCFDVQPRTGVLPPRGAAPTPFTVSYSPTEYRGRPFVGKVVILTDELQWTFEVRGTHPQLPRPDPLPSIDNRISREALDALAAAQAATARTDYVAANKEALKRLQARARTAARPAGGRTSPGT